MALSNTFNFAMVRDDFVRESMLNIGAIGEAEVATAQEVSDCSRKLNMLVKQWMGKQDFAPGLKMWTRQRADLFLSSTIHKYYLGPNGPVANASNWAGGVATSTAMYTQQQTSGTTASGSAVLNFTSTANFTAGDFVVVQVTNAAGNIDIFSSTVASITPNVSVTMNAVLPTGVTAGLNAYVWNYTTVGQRPLEIATCILRDINNNDTPIDTMTLMEYEQLPSKVQVGNTADPTKIYYESQFAVGTNPQGPGVLYIDCYGAQDVTKHLHVVYLRPVMDLNNPGDNVEYPQQWYRALCWGLSKEIAPMFDATDAWGPVEEGNLQDALKMAREPDSETSPMFFTVRE